MKMTTTLDEGRWQPKHILQSAVIKAATDKRTYSYLAVAGNNNHRKEKNGNRAVAIGAVSEV